MSKTKVSNREIQELFKEGNLVARALRLPVKKGDVVYDLSEFANEWRFLNTKKSVSTFKNLYGELKSLFKVIGAGMFALFLAVPIYVLVTIAANSREPDIANILYMISGIMTILLLYCASIANNVLLTMFYMIASEGSLLQDINIDKDLLNKALVKRKSLLG